MSKQPTKSKHSTRSGASRPQAPKVAPKATAKAALKAPAPKVMPPVDTDDKPKAKRMARPKGGIEDVPNAIPINVEGDANTNELATVGANVVLSLRDLTIKRYQSRGWQIMATPRGGINDLVAGKDVNNKYKYHFVQFVDSEDEIDNAPRYKGEAKGAFIQNAYSNQATPVYVIPRRSGANRKVVLENADTTQKIIP